MDMDGDVDMSFERPWDDAPSDEEDTLEPSPAAESSSKHSTSDTVTSDPRVRFRQELNGLKHQGSSDPPSPLDAASPLASMSVVSVGRISR